MQRLIFSFGLTLVLCASGCQPGLRLVDSDFNYNGNFSEYQSFGFVGFKESGLNPDFAEMVKNVVVRRLTSMGYNYDSNNPDVWITYKYLTEDMTLHGYDQSSLTSWVFKQSIIGDVENQKSYTRNKVQLHSGSMILYIMESQRGEVVWLGYSQIEDIELHERNLIASVGLILDEYAVTGY